MIKIKIVHSLFLCYRFLPSLCRLEIQLSWQVSTKLSCCSSLFWFLKLIPEKCSSSGFQWRWRASSMVCSPFCCLPQYSFGCFFLWIGPAHNEGLRLFNNGIDNSPYDSPWGSFFVICCLHKTSIRKFLLALCQGLGVTNLYAKIGSTRARKRLFPLVDIDIFSDLDNFKVQIFLNFLHGIQACAFRFLTYFCIWRHWLASVKWLNTVIRRVSVALSLCSLYHEIEWKKLLRRKWNEESSHLYQPGPRLYQNVILLSDYKIDKHSRQYHLKEKKKQYGSGNS